MAALWAPTIRIDSEDRMYGGTLFRNLPLSDVEVTELWIVWGRDNDLGRQDSRLKVGVSTANTTLQKQT